MNPKILLLGLMLLLIPIVSAIPECQSVTFPAVDCVVITPVITCDNYTYDIFNSTQQIVNDSNLTQIGETSIYFFVFNYDYEDSFLIKLCNNYTRTITTSFNATTIAIEPVLGQIRTTIPMYLTFIVIAVVLFAFGYFTSNKWIIFSSAAVLILISSALFANGISVNTSSLTDTIDTGIGFSRSMETKNYENVNTSVTNALAIILLLIGMAIFIATILSGEFKEH